MAIVFRITRHPAKPAMIIANTYVNPSPAVISEAPKFPISVKKAPMIAGRLIKTEKRTANLRLYPHNSAAHNVNPILEIPGKTAIP